MVIFCIPSQDSEVLRQTHLALVDVTESFNHPLLYTALLSGVAPNEKNFYSSTPTVTKVEEMISARTKTLRDLLDISSECCSHASVW